MSRTKGKENEIDKALTLLSPPAILARGGLRQLAGGLKDHGIVAYRHKFSSRYLSSFNFKAQTIIDVGSHSGTQSLYEAFMDRRFLMIDPLPQNHKNLKLNWAELNAIHVEAAAGAQTGRMTIHEDIDNSDHSSLLDTNMDSNTRDLEVDLKRVDELVQEHKLPGPYGLKIDTEGFELEVIKGCAGIMQEVEFVVMETSIKKRFKGSYRFSEAVAELATFDFELFDVLNAAGFAPRFFDCLFLHADDTRFDI